MMTEGCGRCFTLDGRLQGNSCSASLLVERILVTLVHCNITRALAFLAPSMIYSLILLNALLSLSIQTARNALKYSLIHILYTNMSTPSTQDNLDAAAAFLQNFVMAQQQQQQPAPAAAPQAPAQAPQAAQTPAYLQQLILAAQQQVQQQQQAAAPAPQPPQPHPDSNIAQLLAQAMNMAQLQHQQQTGAPAASAAPVAPPPQSYQHIPHQQNVSTHGSVASAAPIAAAPQQQQHQSLLSSAHLLGLNPSLAAALMTSALQQTTAPVPAAAAPAASGSAAATHPSSAPHVPSLLATPFGLPGNGAFQQHRPPPVTHSISKMQRWTLEQLGKFDKCLVWFAPFFSSK